MRILMCNYEYPPLGGGGGVATAQLAQVLAGRHEVTVLTSLGPDLPRDSVEQGVRVVRVPVFFRRQQATASLLSMLAYIPSGIREGKRLLRSGGYDVINTHFVVPTGPVGHALARFAEIPNVLTVHGGDLYDPSKFSSPHRHPLLRMWIRRLLCQADSVVGQSNNTLANLHRYYTRKVEGIRIPLGIHRPPPVAARREDYGFGQGDTLLVAVGRLVARKATHQLIAVMEAFRDEPVYLLIVGTGPQEAMLRQEVARRGLGDRVRFMGFVEEEEKFRLLRISDVYVSTSQHEGFGLVFLEAMACGLPVVCYDHGGQTDFLQDRETGFLLPLNDVEGFREQCRTLIDSPELRRRMGQECLDRVEEFYIEHCAREYEAAFERAVGLHRKELHLGLSHRS